MGIVEKQIVISASPETIFHIYQDVDNWNKWDPDTKFSILINGLTLGSKGRLTPAKGNTVPIEVSSIQENRHFTVVSKTALFRMDFDHELEPVVGGTRVVHRVKFAGLLKPILTRILGPQIDKGLPVTLQRLKALAEATQAGNA
jgi:Polyketide cyclase / dehydrase and lipid transport